MANSCNQLHTDANGNKNNQLVTKTVWVGTRSGVPCILNTFRFKALKQNSDGKTALCLAMGIRHLLNPLLPVGYYINAFQSANAVLTGEDLNEWSLSRVAKMIEESKKVASDTNYIWNSINLLETLRHHKMKIDTGSECLN
ncbi:hypothetical protein RJ639_035193 [Escallonia herrerae]|uniref:Uncharacterized protein n=1 Tax=Escallonia herrerae TaxID=1293975 RepID=A0AA89B7M8_9ASTE|nr:hypothetical protein RJ639_035193 [Escallonia herrerae]